MGLAIASIYLCWLMILVFAQDQLIFPRSRGLIRMGELDRPGVEVVWLDTEEGRLPAWFIPGQGASKESPQRLLVLLHGNGNIIDDWYDLGLGTDAAHGLAPAMTWHDDPPGSDARHRLLGGHGR